MEAPERPKEKSFTKKEKKHMTFKRSWRIVVPGIKKGVP